MKGRWIQTLTWPEAKDLIQAGWPVMVPIGAISKEHGRHLPLNTDFLYARALADRIAAELPVLIAPIISFGYYPVAPELVHIECVQEDYGHASTKPESCFYLPTVFDCNPASGPDYSATGARGDPRHASAEKGNAILAEMARELVGAQFSDVLAEGPA